MENCVPMKIIAHMNSPFPTKFGIPRQSGLVAELQAKIVTTAIPKVVIN